MNQKTKTLSLPLTSSIAILTFIGLSLLSLIFPFSLGHPQWLVGAIVNACLFLSAIFLPKKYFAPLIILPSLGVLGRGIIFGPFTYFLVYFLPFIWFGNLILILFFKKLYRTFDSKLSHSRFFLAVFCASAVKFLFLMAVANLYFGLNLVPKLFLQVMGINQLFTALAGGAIAWFILNFYYAQCHNLDGSGQK